MPIESSLRSPTWACNIFWFINCFVKSWMILKTNFNVFARYEHLQSVLWAQGGSPASSRNSPGVQSTDQTTHQNAETDPDAPTVALRITHLKIITCSRKVVQFWKENWCMCLRRYFLLSLGHKPAVENHLESEGNPVLHGEFMCLRR